MGVIEAIDEAKLRLECLRLVMGGNKQPSNKQALTAAKAFAAFVLDNQVQAVPEAAEEQ